MGVVDWGLAQRIAIGLAGEGPRWDGDEAELRAESDRAARLVRRYTRLRARGGLPAAELVGRSEWALVNLTSFRDMSAGVEEKLSERMREDGKEAGMGERIAGAAAGAEVGLAVGYLAQRVIGQYDIALIGPARAPRLLFVGPNLSAARERLRVDRELFLRWIALHETTHAVQFAGVPWLRPHLGSIASELFEQAAIEIKPGEVLGKLVRMNPRELVRTVTGGELAQLFWTEPQRELVDRLLAAMTVIEGYAEHVMDAVGEQLDPRYADLRGALDRDRERRGPLEALISRLLGLEMKMAQYRRGKVFCDAVAAEVGIKGLNVVWRSAEHLPSQAELEAPAEWIERTGARRPSRLLALFR
ncbi:MAG TPA: zinc-dependent metalloprotease [Solirubrobacterales bacterium]|nr:zinc-dependent metalloprotease [Solirubrobacterales bacterium]